DREVADAHALLRQSFEICREEIDAAGHRLVLDLDAESYHIEGDPARLQQVFWNLVKNAVKFTPPGGTILVRSHNRTPSGADRPELVVCGIDDGIGIEPWLLPRVFDAFTQGEAGHIRRFGGLGLGLAISRSVVEAHGGRLTASSPGKGLGSTFEVALATIP